MKHIKIFLLLILTLISNSIWGADKLKIIFFDLPTESNSNLELKSKYSYIIENIPEKILKKYEIKLYHFSYNDSAFLKEEIYRGNFIIKYVPIRVKKCDEISSFEINRKLINEGSSNMAVLRNSYFGNLPNQILNIDSLEDSYEATIISKIEALAKNKEVKNIGIILGNNYLPVKPKISFLKETENVKTNSKLSLTPIMSSSQIKKIIWFPDDKLSCNDCDNPYLNVGESDKKIYVYYIDNNDCYSDTANFFVKVDDSENSSNVDYTEGVITNSGNVEFVFEGGAATPWFQKKGINNKNVKGNWFALPKSGGAKKFKFFTTTSKFDSYKFVMKNSDGQIIYTNEVYNPKLEKNLFLFDIALDDSIEIKSRLEVEIFIYTKKDDGAYQLNDSEEIILNHCN